MKTIIRAIEKYQMISPGETVVVGLSGGADSVALTHFLHRFGAKVTAVHVNHMLRGEESLRDEAFVKAFCEAMSIPCVIYRVDVAAKAKESGQSIEEAGRECRYRLFAKQAEKFNAKIATAHTLSDQAETMLFRLARGSGMRGLCGIPPVRKTPEGFTVIRPLIESTREEIEAYCKEQGLKFVTDSSNLSDDYARNLIRHRIMPVLREINSSAEQHFGNTAEQLAAEEDFLSDEAQKAYAACREGDGLSAVRLMQLHPALCRRVLFLFLKENGIAADSLMLKRLVDLAKKQLLPQTDLRYGAVSLPGNVQCLLRDGRLYLTKPQEQGVFPADLDARLKQAGEAEFLMPSGVCWKFSRIDTKPIQKIHKNLFFFCLDYDKIKGVLTCRKRMPGDRVTIAGRDVTKTVKKWMNEEGILLSEREKRFVLADEEGVLMVEGLGIAERAAADASTRHLLVVTARDRAE